MVAALALSCIMFSACEPDEPNDPINVKPSEKGLYILCEGSGDGNNSTIDFYSIDKDEITKDFFNRVNGSGFGALGNDIVAYGSKVYIAVQLSGVVTVINRQDGKLIKRIVMQDNSGNNKQPSKLCSANGKVYVACYNGTVAEIDTASLNVKRQANVGRNPAGITVANSKLFVSNSGGLDIVFDSTVSVINLSDFAVSTITVGLNPGITRTLADGNVMVLLLGNYYDINPSLVTINSQTHQIIRRDNVNASSFAVCGNNVIYLYYDYMTGSSIIKTAPYDNIAASSTNFVQENSILNSINTPYCVSVNTSANEVYITDVKNYTSSGEVLCFDYSGMLKYRFSTSINPSVVLQK
jgi:YVTN family beta-propeller protein